MLCTTPSHLSCRARGGGCAMVSCQPAPSLHVGDSQLLSLSPTFSRSGFSSFSSFSYLPCFPSSSRCVPRPSQVPVHTGPLQVGHLAHRRHRLRRRHQPDVFPEETWWGRRLLPERAPLEVCPNLGRDHRRLRRRHGGAQKQQQQQQPQQQQQQQPQQQQPQYRCYSTLTSFF